MTRLFGVIGHPIGQSLSPVMHTAALRAMRRDALYAPFDVPPQCLKPILHAFILAGVEGLNVTVPLKEAIVPLLDRVDPTAHAVGAVNTIVIRNRRTVGYNTDGIGFRRALEELGWRPKGIPSRVEGRPRPTHVVILGAGGAARAVAWELSRSGVRRLTIANRHLPRARRLARWVRRLSPRAKARAVPISQVTLKDADLLINATTVGMRASDPAPIALATLQRRTMVYDLVYHRETALVRTARRRGCVAANGLSMLLYQGAESLRLWLHRAPPIEVMRRALERAVQSPT